MSAGPITISTKLTVTVRWKLEYSMSKLIVKDLEGPSTTSNKIYIASGSQLDIAGSPGGSGAINLAVDAGDITTGTVANARLANGHVLQATAPLVATGASSRAEGQTIAPGYVGGTQASGEIAWDTGSHFIDSPNTTSAITYSIQWHGRATSTFTNYVNKAYSDGDADYVGRGVTVITAMEIKA
jgi:hypothetical protein